MKPRPLESMTPAWGEPRDRRHVRGHRAAAGNLWLGLCPRMGPSLGSNMPGTGEGGVKRRGQAHDIALLERILRVRPEARQG